MTITIRPATNRLVVALLVYLGLIVGLPETIAGQEQERALFMFVMDQSGEAVLDLTAEEIRIEQAGGECTIANMQPEINGMKIALLIDASQPARPSLNSLRDGLRDFLETIEPIHEIGLVTIAGQTRLRVEFTTDREALREDVDNLFIDSAGGTVLLDGLVETWERRFNDDDAWPVFVMLVYDGPEASRSVQEHEFNDFVQEIRARGTTAHAILVSTRGGGLQTNVAVNITENTGGVYEAIAAATAIPRTLTELATTMNAQYEELKNRYRIVYQCTPEQPEVPLSIALSRPAVGVRLFAERRPAP